MMISLNKYIQYVPAYFRNKPVYMEILKIFLQNYIDMFNLIQNFPSKIVLETDNTYVLDMLGEIFNVSRYVNPPIYLANFSWNINRLGWNQGNWSLDNTAKTYTYINDFLYKWIVNFKAKLTLWNGSNEHLVSILEDVFETIDFTLVDNMNNSITIYCKFNEHTSYEEIQLLLNGALELNLTGTKIYWEEHNA